MESLLKCVSTLPPDDTSDLINVFTISARIPVITLLHPIACAPPNRSRREPTTGHIASQREFWQNGYSFQQKTHAIGIL
jgi:hypothetical protein